MKKRMLALLLVAAMTFSLAACGGSSSDDKKEETKTETTDNTDNKETPEVDTVHWGRANSGNILVTIAKQQGYFDEVGINVVEDPVESSTAALQALQAGQLGSTIDSGKLCIFGKTTKLQCFFNHRCEIFGFPDMHHFRELYHFRCKYTVCVALLRRHQAIRSK